MMNDPIPNLIAFDAASLDNAFAAVEQQAREDSSALTGPDAVEAFRLKWLGRKQGLLNEVSSRWLKAAPPDAKKAVGERFKTSRNSSSAFSMNHPAQDRVTPRWPPTPLISPCPAPSALSAQNTPSRAHSTKLPVSLLRSVTRSVSGLRSKPISTTSSP